MTTGQKTFEVLSQFGVMTDCKSLGILFDRQSNLWEVSGHFQNENGRKNARVAQFDLVDDAVDFKVCFEQMAR